MGRERSSSSGGLLAARTAGLGKKEQEDALREASLLRELGGHPNIVRFIESFIEAGKLFIVSVCNRGAAAEVSAKGSAPTRCPPARACR